MSSHPHVVLIDNYDSFTWNVYEVLSREGARVSVYRNDQITVPEIEALKPDQILISPGPGNPEDDSGVSREVIMHFMGRVPIFGICMGLQCMVSALGGKVESAGEIYHGKTSYITHNNTGCFKGVTQGVSATRYHSLAANFESLPSCLEVTARLEESGIVQGVRHKEYILEGVQFHPESILTQEGNVMLRNFLRYKGGKWSDLKDQQDKFEQKKMTSILDEIYAQRRLDVAAQEHVLGQKLEDLERSIDMGLAPEQVDFEDSLRQQSPQRMSLIAEIKRASPSKGSMAPQIHAPTLALEYARAGASAISVLTEPKWFKGSLEDLRLVRLALNKLNKPDKKRPAVLRKEFVFSPYQIAEARLAGADSVLLIVKMLTDAELRMLYEYSKKHGMEPLVEVSNSEEMRRALDLGARIIGINNRDLHSFNVDMSTTSSLISNLDKNSVVLAALSGITGAEHVRQYAKEGVQAILVGEALVRAPNTAELARSLIELPK